MFFEKCEVENMNKEVLDIFRGHQRCIVGLQNEIEILERRIKKLELKR